MTLYQDIRGALQARLGTVAGIPAIVYEGVRYEPVVGTPFCECAVYPVRGRPSTMGSGHLVMHQGLFMVTLVYPSGKGTGTAEAMADLVKASFTADTTLTQGTNTVRLRYAERKSAIIDTDWIRVPVEIGWYLHTETY